MAYTMSDADNQKIVQYQQAYNAAKAAGDTAAMERAHAGAEAVRNSYGFSGGADGSQQVSIAPRQTQANPYVSYLDTVKQAQAQAQDRYNQMMEYSQQSYANMLKNAIAANNAAAAQQVARLNSQKTDVNKTYEDNARQAYVAYMQGKQTLPQMLAASGLTGGATETANLGLVTNYNTNVGNINNERASAIKSIDDNIQQAMYQAERDNAATAYDNAGSALNSYLGIMGNSIDSDYNYLNTYGNAYGRYVDQENYQSDVQREAEKLAYQRQQALADQTYERSLQRLQLGMANAQDLAELGLTENDYNTYLMENFGRDINGNYIVPPAGSSGGGGSSGGSGRRSSSGRSYGSGGGNTGGGSIGDYPVGSDGWNEAVRKAAQAQGISPEQYIRNNYKGSLGLGNQDNMKAAIASAQRYEEKAKSTKAQAQAAMKTAGTVTGNTGTKTQSANTGGSPYEKTIDALYNRGLLNANQAIKLFDATSKK